MRELTVIIEEDSDVVLSLAIFVLLKNLQRATLDGTTGFTSEKASKFRWPS